MFFLSLIVLNGQGASHNYGNLKIHEEGAIGFYHSLINDGIMDENQGVAGFYSDNSLIISGAFRPIFNDIEVIAANDLVLEVGVGVTNNANFILGDVETPRTLSKINLEFISGSYYNGEAQMTKVNGYAAITNKQNFIFPIGDLDKLRPLELSSESINTTAKSAYFFEP